MFQNIKLVFKLFGEENAQNHFVVSFTHGVTNKEEHKREKDTQNNLVQAHQLYLHSHGYALTPDTAAHGSNGTIFISLGPEETKNQYPEEGRFQAAEGEHINLPDNSGWINGDSINY